MVLLKVMSVLKRGREGLVCEQPMQGLESRTLTMKDNTDNTQPPRRSARLLCGAVRMRKN